MASFAHAQNSVNHRLEEAHTSYKPSLAEDDAGSRGAAGGGSADRAAAASEYDLPAVHERALRRRGRRWLGDQGREEKYASLRF